MARNVSRRDVLGGSLLALGLFAGSASGLHAEELIPASAPFAPDIPAGPPVTLAVIGLGEQGRNLLTSLQYVKGAKVAYVCDSYVGAHKKALALHPNAKAVTDYKAVLDDKTVQGVFVATPTHKHKQIVLDALQAGKHVYCEAPLSNTIDEARVIAKAAQAASPKVILHAGLPERTNPQHHHVGKFVETGALATVAQAKAVWHRKSSWRRSAPSDERQNELNWRLDKSVSTGLPGEVGIHQFDTANWYLRAFPKSVMGFGSITAWRDGRQVPDTVQCIFEYPDGVHLAFDATLANSYDGTYELFQGTDAAILLREGRAWMFKEPDAKALGWEVYAFKEQVGDDTGIALVANASKLLADGKEPAKNRETDPLKGTQYWACESFVGEIRDGKAGEGCGALEAFTATVTAIKANEAVVAGTKIAFTPEMFVL
jgi:predicted dehydrogenase